MTVHPYTRLFPKTSSPTVDDDVSLGYEVGDVWVHTGLKQSWQLVDATDGAAVWVKSNTLGIEDLFDVDLTDLANGVILRYDTDDAKWFAVDGALVFATADEGVPNGSSHDHNGGDGAQIAHGNLSGIGSNSHATLDSHLSNTSNPHSVTAAQAGALPVDANGMVAIGQKQVNINDDAVYSFTPPSPGGFLLVGVYSSTGNTSWGIYSYRTAATTHMLAMVAGTNIDRTTGALTGTTGTDGHMTVSCHSDGKIYVENRLGAAKTVNISVI